MQDRLLCKRKGHGMPLDMICINNACPFKGLICHKCFLDNPHQHLSGDIMSLDKFLQKCDNILNKPASAQLNLNSGQIGTLNEEYQGVKEMIETFKDRAQSSLQKLIKRLERNTNLAFATLLEATKAPKSTLQATLESTVNMIRSKGYKDLEVINSQLNILCPCLEHRNNELILVEAKQSGEINSGLSLSTINEFKKELVRVRDLLDKGIEWIEKMPNPDITTINHGIGSLSSSPSRIKKPVLLEKPNSTMRFSLPMEERKLDVKMEYDPEESYKKKENIKKGVEKEVSIKNSRKLEDPERIVGDSPQKKVKTYEPFMLTTKIFPGSSSPIKGLDKPINLQRLLLDEMTYTHFSYLDLHAITFKTEKDLLLRGFSSYSIHKPEITATFDYVLMQ